MSQPIGWDAYILSYRLRFDAQIRQRIVGQITGCSPGVGNKIFDSSLF